ncbi:MAG: hypothetical protein QG570_48 [Patescibacteria group bacterium]|nr:hypothetical protein [Patescibacteria group bacterium]
MVNKFLNKDDLAKLKSQTPSSKKIVFTYGTFDLIHSGHAAYLVEAKNLGDVLIVGVTTNKSRREMRGKGFPLVDQKNRAELLTFFDFVDGVIYVDDRNLLQHLKILKPDIFFTHSLDWKSHLRKPAEEKFVESYGGQVYKRKPNGPFVSSSMIVELVADLKIKEVVEYFFGKIKIDLANGNWKVGAFSGLKTKIRTESLVFPEHLMTLGLFGSKFGRKIIPQNKLSIIVKKLKKESKKIVLSSGSCDLLHAGHVRFFSKAKEEGEILILGIPTDRIIKKQKGRGRPIINENSRAELMSFFPFIDYIFLFDDESIFPPLMDLQPDVFFTVKEEWNNIEKSSISDNIKEWGGKIVTAPPQADGLSSSKLIKRAAGIRVRELFKEVLHEAEKLTSLKD